MTSLRVVPQRDSHTRRSCQWNSVREFPESDGVSGFHQAIKPTNQLKLSIHIQLATTGHWPPSLSRVCLGGRGRGRGFPLLARVLHWSLFVCVCCFVVCEHECVFVCERLLR